MADVTGDLGGQPIQLNNAATEITLKQILAAMLAQTAAMAKQGKAGAGGMDPKTLKELEKELERLAKASKKQKEESEALQKAQRDETEEKKKALEHEKKKGLFSAKELKQMQQTMSSLATLGSAVSGVALGMTNLMSALANTGNSMSAAAQTMNNIPIVGGVLAGVFGAVAGAAEKTYKAFQQSASVGANFGGSIVTMIDSATAAGLTFEQFSGIIARNGQQLALLGGTSEEGAKRLAQLGKTIKNSPLGNDLARMGYSTEQINEGFAKYSAQLAATGKLQGMSNSQLVAQTGAYLQDLDALTKLTGKNRADLEKEREARLKDSQFRNIMSKLDADSQRNLQNLMDSIPAEHQEGMKEIIATGTATSEAGKKALAFLPESARNMMQLNQQIRTTGKMGADQAARINAAYKQEVTNFTKSGVAENMALYGDEASKRFYVGAMDAAANQKTLGQVQAEQQKAAAERAAKEKQLQAEGLDPAKLKEYQEKIAQTSNTFTKFLATSGLLDTMMQAFTMLTDFTISYVVPAFQWMARNFETIVLVATPLIALFAILKAAIFAHNVVQALQTLGVTASLAPLAAMAGAALAVALPILALVAAGWALYKGFQWISDKVKEAGWSFSDVFEAIGDNLKRFALFYTDIWLAIAEKVAKFFGGGDTIKAMRDRIKEEQTELDEKEKARDQRRKEAGDKYKQEKALKEQKEKELEASKKLTEQKAQEAKAGASAASANEANAAAAAAAPPPIDFSSPQKMFDSMKKRMEGQAQQQQQPGTTTTAPVTGTSTAPPPVNQDQKKNMELVKAALIKQGITDPKYIAATLGNVMKETGGKSISENMNYGGTSNDRIRKIFGSRAAGKTDAELDAIKKDPSKMGEMMYGAGTKLGQQMGNTEPGDGFKFRGRGFIQLTGKNNYAAASKAIYGDDRLVQNPDLVNNPEVAAQVSAWYMKKGQTSMASKLGINTANMTQEQANLLATSQIAGGDIRKKGAIGAEISAKVDKFSTQMAGIAGAPVAPDASQALAQVRTPATTTTPAATTTQTALAQNKPADTVAAEQERIRREGKAVPGTGTVGSQDTPAGLLSALNTKMDTLISLTRRVNEVNERQLSVQRNIAQSGDLYSAA
jgi:predicted chitinase